MALKSVITPAKIIQAKKHTCSLCGNYGVWKKGWGYYIVLSGEGWGAGELYFKVCSDVCHEKAKKENLIEKFKMKHSV